MKHKKPENILVNRQYGKWNAILATHQGIKYIFRQNHSKIFPETLSDWVNAIKQTLIHQKFHPVRLDIDITNNCSNDCIMCFAKELREKIRATIPLEKLINIFNNFKELGGESVRLTGGGDPLNHPDIINIIKYLGKLDLKITIETNGDHLSPEVIDIIAKYVRHLRISVDSFDNASRELVHRSCLTHCTYDALIQKIKLIRNRASAHNRNEELFLGTTFVILPENFSSVDKFVKDMHDIGVNWVAIRKNIYREIYQKHPDIIPSVEKKLTILKEELDNINSDFTIEEQYGVSFQPKNDFTTCWISHIRPIVLADASLQLCCLARNGIIEEAHVGTLPDSSAPISQLLNTNSSVVDHFRNVVPEKCQLCIDKDNNISLSHISSLLKINEDFEFCKAKVSECADKRTCLDKNKIMHISLTKKQHALFQEGKLIKI